MLRSNMIKAICSIILISVLAGCVLTQVKGFTDLDYQGYRVKKIAIRAANANFAFGEMFEQSMVSRMQNKNIQAVSFMEMFPPTRKWTNEQIANELTKRGFDTIMYMNLTGSGSSSETIGYINNGSVNTYGNTATFNSVSVPITGRSRNTAVRITIYDVATAKTIWIGDTATHAGGLAFVGDQTQTDNIAGEVVETLERDGHL